MPEVTPTLDLTPKEKTLPNQAAIELAGMLVKRLLSEGGSRLRDTAIAEASPAEKLVVETARRTRVVTDPTVYVLPSQSLLGELVGSEVYANEILNTITGVFAPQVQALLLEIAHKLSQAVEEASASAIPVN